MSRSSKPAHESAAHPLESVLGLWGRQLRRRRLFADNQAQLRHQIDDERAIEAESLAQGLAPNRQLRIAFPEQRSDERLKRLRQCRVRNVALVLIELAGCKPPAR